jgi:hypothetical protein
LCDYSHHSSIYLSASIGIGYNRSVRRLLAISLLLLFSFPLVSPLLALSANPETNLPACCRRDGKHHCQMNMQRSSASTDGAAVFATPS